MLQIIPLVFVLVLDDRIIEREYDEFEVFYPAPLEACLAYKVERKYGSWLNYHCVTDDKQTVFFQVHGATDV